MENLIDQKEGGREGLGPVSSISQRKDHKSTMSCQGKQLQSSYLWHGLWQLAPERIEDRFILMSTKQQINQNQNLIIITVGISEYVDSSIWYLPQLYDPSKYACNHSFHLQTLAKYEQSATFKNQSNRDAS